MAGRKPATAEGIASQTRAIGIAWGDSRCLSLSVTGIRQATATPDDSPASLEEAKARVRIAASVSVPPATELRMGFHEAPVGKRTARSKRPILRSNPKLSHVVAEDLRPRACVEATATKKMGVNACECEKSLPRRVPSPKARVPDVAPDTAAAFDREQ